MKKSKKFFILSLLFISILFSFISNNYIYCAENNNYFDLNTTSFSSYLTSSDINLEEIKSFISSYYNDDKYKDEPTLQHFLSSLSNFNTIITQKYNNCFTVRLYNDNTFNKNKFYYGKGGSFKDFTGIVIDKSDINFPMEYFSISFTENNNIINRTIDYFSFDESLYISNYSSYPYLIRVDLNGTNNVDTRYDNNYFYTNFDIIDYKTGENLKKADITNEKEVEIGDKNSRLKLSYEYNEDYTECKINATLEGGQFTDRIFYSNYMPSIAGQGLLSKKAFPRERYNCK